MTIFKTFRRKQFPQVVLLIVLGAFFVVMGILSIGSQNPEPVNVNTLTQESLEVDTFVAITEFAPLVEFATETMGDDEYTYMIIAVEDVNRDVVLMGLRITTAEAETIWSYVDENATEAVWISELPYHGTVYAIPSEATGYFQEGLDWLEVGNEFPIANVYLEAVKGTFVPNTSEPLIIGIGFGVIGLGVLLFPLLYFVGYFNRKTLKAIQDVALGGNAAQWLDQFETEATQVEGVYISKDALIYPAGIGSQFVKADEVVWAYGHKQDRTVYFIIKIATHHFVMLRTSTRKTFLIPCKSKASAETLFDTLQTLWPSIILGYHADLERLYKADPAGFILAVKALDA